MTVTMPAQRVATPADAWRARAVAWGPDLAVTATLAWWASYLTWGTGGREPHVLSIGCVLLAVSFVVVRPWKALPRVAFVLAHAVGVAAWLVVLTAPTGWAGADEAASYTFAAELGLMVLAWAGSTQRRHLVLTAVVGAAGAQFAVGWLSWWGMQDTMRLFEGTFYWHNQAGIFMAAGAVLGFAAIAAGRPVSLLGWTVAPVCVAGVVFTTSRGSTIALGLGVVLLLGLLRRGHLRVLAGVALSWAVASALTGPPFFAARVAPIASTEARSESLTGNGVQRFEDWRRAFEIFKDWPISGAGFNSFDSAAGVVTSYRDGVRTAFAHNGFLQAVADGGLVLSVPLFTLIGVVLLVALRALPAAIRDRDAVRLGGVSTLIVLLLHSGMDFDWTYPSLLAMLALVGVLALPVPTPKRSRATWVDAALVAVGVTLILAGAVAGWNGGLDLSTPVS